MRSRLLAAASAAAFLVVPPAANAALSFRFDRASARPGQTLVAAQPGRWSGPSAGIVVYLVPTRPHGVSPDPAGGWRLSRPPARLVVRLGPARPVSGRLAVRFRVPRVRPGDYTSAFWCRPCAPPRGDFFPSVLWGAPWTGRPGGVLRVLH